MTLRWLIVLALGILVSIAGAAQAAEPYLEFVRGLRDREYYDYALIYLDELEKRADVPREIKEVVPFEKAITLLRGADRLRTPELQTRQLDQAQGFLEQFLKASPNHPDAGAANTELANVIVGKGKIEVQNSKSPGNVAQKAELQKKARRYFAQARQVYQAAHDRYKEEVGKFEKYIPNTEKAKYEAREAARVRYINAQLNLAILIYEEAQTWDKGSPENKKLLTEAAKAFDDIHAHHRQLVGGLYARLWEGKCFEEQDDIRKALGFYAELLEHGAKEKPSSELKRLQDRVLRFRLICLNSEQRKDYQVAIQDAQAWLKENRSLASSLNGLGIQWELVRAQEMLAKKEATTDADKTRLLQQALATARAINRYQGEYKESSTAMIQRLMVALDRDPKDPKDLATAFSLAQGMVQSIAKKADQIYDARGAEHDNLVAELQRDLKEAARILNIGLAAASAKDDLKDVNRARFFLAYVYFKMRENARDGLFDRSYDAAVLAEFVARKCIATQPELALESAYLAQLAYSQAYRREIDDRRAADASDLKRMIDVCNFIAQNWPDSDKANDARIDLGKMYGQLQQPAEAAKWYMQVPESSPQYLAAQLAAGNAYWFAFAVESIRPEAERKPQAELDALVERSREILRNAIVKFEAQLPGDISQVDETKLESLTKAKANYAQIMNNSGDYRGALGLLTEGPLSVIAAVAPPGGNENNRPAEGGIRGRKFAGAVYQVLLRSFVGLQDLDKARAAMRELESIVGTGGGGESLTRIYLELGKELQKEVERLQTARDSRLAEVLKSFDTFLEDMSNRKEGHDFSSLIWVASTYRALGEGLQQGDSSKAESYFARAVAALQQLLDAEAKNPGTIPAGGLPGVQLRLVACKRLQKDFAEAHKTIVAILKIRPKALDVQEEAAQLFQDWGAHGDLDKWQIAIEGGAARKAGQDEKRVWGWRGLADRLQSNLLTNPNPDYEKKYLDARYNVANCWFRYATAQSTDKGRKKLLSEAHKAVLATAGVIPNLGGGEIWSRFNHLHRDIQQQMLDLGMDEMRGKEVADLERRGRLTKEERAAQAAEKKKAAESALASADDSQEAAKPKSKKKRKAKADAAAKAASGGGWMWPALGAALALCGGAAGYAYFTQGKKKKRRRSTDGDDDAPRGASKSPSARSRT